MKPLYAVVLGTALLLETLGPVYAQQGKATQTPPQSPKTAQTSPTGKQGGKKATSPANPPKQTAVKAGTAPKQTPPKKQVPPSGAKKKPVKKVHKAHPAKRHAHKASKSAAHKAQGPKTQPKKVGTGTKKASGNPKNGGSRQEQARKEVQRK